MSTKLHTFWHRILRRPHRLKLSEKGKGKPLVLLHGIAANGAVWQPLVAKLDKTTWRIMVPDLLGFGGSPKPDWSSYDVQTHAKSLVLTLKKQRLKQPAVLVAHSMGCLVAIHVAITHPRLVKRLVLYEPPLFVDEPAYRRHSRRRGQYFRLYEYIARHPQLILAESRMLQKLIARLHGVNMTPDEWLPFERSLRNTIMQQQAYNELARIQVPTDIIQGRLDFVVTRAQVRRMFKDNPRVNLHVVNHLHSISARAATYLARLIERT